MSETGPEPLLRHLALSLDQRVRLVLDRVRDQLPDDADGIPMGEQLPDLAQPVMSFDLPALAIEAYPALCLGLVNTPRVVPSTPDMRTGAPRLEITTAVNVYSYVRSNRGYEATARLADRYCLATRLALLSRPAFPGGVIDLAGYAERYRELVPLTESGRTLGGTIHTVHVKTVEVVDDGWLLDPDTTEHGTVGLPADVELDVEVDRTWPTGHPAL